VVLVERGFVAADGAGNPGAVPAAPSGTVELVGRLETADTKKDHAGRAHAEITAINPTEQAARSGQPTYAAYLKLLARQPGTAGLTPLPKPDLSNPAGGAYEAQHFAYIVQWYLFALIALIAPFAIARNEVRDAQRRFLGVDVGELELSLSPPDRPATLPSADNRRDGELAVRGTGELVARIEVDSPAYRRAQRVADRYGRALKLSDGAPVVAKTTGARPARRIGGVPDDAPAFEAADSSSTPHRSHDGYHGSYNDYLWQLGLADRDAPDVVLEPHGGTGTPAGGAVVEGEIVDGVVIDADAADVVPEDGSPGR
jgi:hypothetical protein